MITEIVNELHKAGKIETRDTVSIKAAKDIIAQTLLSQMAAIAEGRWDKVQNFSNIKENPKEIEEDGAGQLN
jgi:hypothetical protein